MQADYVGDTQMPKGFRILCPFCNAPFSAKMDELLSASQGCDTCGHGEGISGQIDVICQNCNKVIYRKLL